MMHIIAATLLLIGMVLPVVVVVLPLIIIAQALGFKADSCVSTQKNKPLEDELIKAQWRYDNIWRRRDK